MEIFVPGRLCLFGEHSDWAGLYNRINSNVLPGIAIVTGIDEGIYASCELSSHFYFRSMSENGEKLDWVEWSLSSKNLRRIAQQGGYYSYVAGVLSFMLEHYDVGGLKIDITKITLPMKKGLSSSAAICVLIVRAFNKLYDLQISVRGEMEAAYHGEIMTPSRCGRLDQACAYGSKPILMHFGSENIEVERLMVGKNLYWVFANLNGHKNTTKILSALNACYPFAQNDIAQHVQKALGAENHRIVNQVVEALRKGDAKRIGELMNESQRVFDDLIAPACLSELASPILHATIADKVVQALSLGAKGVGSHGDGSIQMICENAEKQQELCEYLNNKGLNAYTFTIRAQRSVRKAIIPAAGYGVRMFPASKVTKKELFPIIDKDNIAKPALLSILQDLDDAGIEEIALIINPDDQLQFDRLFERDLTIIHNHRLPKNLRDINVKIQKIARKITYLYQKEQLGFGHAVFQARDFAGEDPVLMLLGDHIYSSRKAINCSEQLIQAYESNGMLTVGIDRVDLDRVIHYGIIAGQFIDDEERTMQVTDMVEKPDVDYAISHMRVKNKKGEDMYYCAFGQYVLTPRVFELLERNIKLKSNEKNEIGLTDVLKEICCSEEMMAYRIDGKRFDIGIPEAYRDTILNYSNNM